MVSRIALRVVAVVGFAGAGWRGRSRYTALLGDGSYVPRSTANLPVTGSSHRVSQIWETDHTNNAAQTCFAVVGRAIASVAPASAPD